MRLAGFISRMELCEPGAENRFLLHPRVSGLLPVDCYLVALYSAIYGTIDLPSQPFSGNVQLVSASARGRGLGRSMAEHCLDEARRLGFCAMQFNFVVSTNEDAIHLWKKLGFKIVGTLPGAFKHPNRGYVDAYVMFRSL